MQNGIVILDGIDYDVGVSSLKRSFEVVDSDSSGRTMDWTMHRDVVGTFYNYNIKVFVQNGNYKDYNSFYEAISSPQVSHRLTVPYGNGSLTFDAYVTKGDDNLIRKSKDGKQLWDGLSINFIALEPQRRS